MTPELETMIGRQWRAMALAEGHTAGLPVMARKPKSGPKTRGLRLAALRAVESGTKRSQQIAREIGSTTPTTAATMRWLMNSGLVTRQLRRNIADWQITPDGRRCLADAEEGA